MNRYHLPARSTEDGLYDTVVTPESAGWTHSGLKVLELEPGGAHTFATGPAEHLVLPLAGSCDVVVDGEHFHLDGRTGVFDGPTDFAYATTDAAVTVRSDGGGRFALASAVCDRGLPNRYGPAEAVPIEHRGAGACARQVRGYCMPGTFDADRLLVCEVVTPGGNWSSYPPHKHDEERDGESVLEEIYYFETDRPEGFAFHRVYGTPERPIDVTAEVRSGDVVLVPHGWHGPSAAAPGYDLFYLNVMAGPGERAWRISDDPAHAWIRTTWETDR
ncbi:5-deoxy-glucuronate isomerase [Glycomyces terrestris]|uniref:5-deoxy-glucuronate isomerase n=1 Tax=Glycomyces terrestris TaxID=2493553 RepID=A0A426V1S8_9ACTN|nr:5-deoxy-glucuronate isomerase [Glycomyces terrestris]RRS00775.1 5-deoxy-glucuronate isomerase [Glycomyces terrestris]